MRVSGGHLCEAEAPTEPTGETTPPYNTLLNIVGAIHELPVKNNMNPRHF